jgi:hypothetical protein
MIEISGMNNDNTEKKRFIENCWLPDINAYQENTNTANGILLKWQTIFKIGRIN